jgi:hypothetical protein
MRYREGAGAIGWWVIVTRINETTVRPTAESLFTARLVSSARVDVAR